MSCDSCLHGRNQGQCLIGRLGFPMIGVCEVCLLGTSG